MNRFIWARLLAAAVVSAAATGCTGSADGEARANDWVTPSPSNCPALTANVPADLGKPTEHVDHTGSPPRPRRVSWSNAGLTREVSLVAAPTGELRGDGLPGATKRTVHARGQQLVEAFAGTTRLFLWQDKNLSGPCRWVGASLVGLTDAERDAVLASIRPAAS